MLKNDFFFKYSKFQVCEYFQILQLTKLKKKQQYDKLNVLKNVCT